MKTPHLPKLLLALSLAASATAQAQLTVPDADGSDGPLIVSTNLTINLANAVSGVWSNNDTANSGLGIYDSSMWAVVFKYSYVAISNGATLTFANHPTHAPVVWLVSSNVLVNGSISLDGQPLGSDPHNLPEPGPGGFRGGAESQTALNDGPGFGPGGGNPNNYGNYLNLPYGTTNIIPLIGGSGGGGGNANGGAGGGAILVAAGGTITVNGSCHAQGGAGSDNYPSYTGGGSGGAIRLVASQILGSGQIQAYGDGGGELGRIRLEGSVANGLTITPTTVGVSPSNPVQLWPDPTAPTAQVISVAGINTPADPKAAMGNSGDDLTIGNTGQIAIQVQTTNFPTNGTVNVYIKPRNGGNQSVLQAGLLSGSTNQATWQVLTTLQLSHSVIQARAVSN